MLLLTAIPVAACVAYFTLIVLDFLPIFYPTLQIPYYSAPIPTPRFYYHPFHHQNEQFDLEIRVGDQWVLGKKVAIEGMDEIHRVEVQLPQAVVNNGTLSAYLTLKIRDEYVIKANHLVTVYAVPEAAQKRYLLEDIKEMEQRPQTHVISVLSVQFVDDRTAYPNTFVPGDIAQNLQLTPSSEYLPFFGVSPLSRFRGELLPVSEKVEMAIELRSVSLGWFRLSRMLDRTFTQMTLPNAPIKISENDANQLKKMVANTDPYLLALTLLAAVLHMLFEWLAFKEDVKHWKDLKTMGGISQTALYLDVLSRAMAVVYLYEKRSETSVVILGGSAVSLGVSLWKIYRYSRTVQRHQEEERISREADAQSTRTIIYLSVPVAVCYALHSLFFRIHAGLWSWAVDTLMMTVYLLGFITMTPQLFLNHRLKSVEAMSLKVFLYRTLNTVVDDLFALVMPMPTLTRAAAFRDDIVFLILLFQWWQYPRRKVKHE